MCLYYIAAYKKGQPTNAATNAAKCGGKAQSAAPCRAAYSGNRHGSLIFRNIHILKKFIAAQWGGPGPPAKGTQGPGVCKGKKNFQNVAGATYF
jgi:hypothetical protein